MSDSIKKKIAALLAKAEGTDNEFEASTFMAKVNELLEKHQIEMHEIRAMGENDPMGHEHGEFNVYASMSWAKIMIHQLAMYYGCTTIWSRNKNHLTYQLVGRESARTTLELMIPFVVTQLRRAAKKYAEERNVSRSIGEREIGHALTLRIYKMVLEQSKVRAEMVGKGLIPVSDVDAYMEENFKTKPGKARSLNTTTSARDHADRISLSAQATGRNIKLIG